MIGPDRNYLSSRQPDWDTRPPPSSSSACQISLSWYMMMTHYHCTAQHAAFTAASYISFNAKHIACRLLMGSSNCIGLKVKSRGGYFICVGIWVIAGLCERKDRLKDVIMENVWVVVWRCFIYSSFDWECHLFAAIKCSSELCVSEIVYSHEKDTVETHWKWITAAKDVKLSLPLSHNSPQLPLQ